MGKSAGAISYWESVGFQTADVMSAWVKVFRINPEFRILRLTFHRKSASKCCIREIIMASLIKF